ncbi:MAG TPA: HD domain-containing phosphohydrolase [Solirubrobacter sp.]|nr:HD domain-containing phosphohydrolase [Solirubrobacter sp.]
MIIWIALVVWLGLVLWSLSVVRAAADTDLPVRERAPVAPARLPFAGRRRAMALAQAALLVAALAAAAAVSDVSQWDSLPLLGLLALLVLGSDILVLNAKRFRIGGSFTGLVLAMALLGPAPAAFLGLASALVDALRRRVHGTYLLNNLLTYTTFPLAGGLALAAVRDATDAEGVFALAVFGVFLTANALNFLMIAGHSRILRGGSLVEMVRTVFVPVLPWEIASAVMTAMAVYGFEVYGAAIIGLFALALGVYQLLLRALLEGQMHSEEIERRTDQLDVRHEGMLGLLLETLALRDPSAARHAAAVAHYGHELARVAGLSEREQAIVHTAGLVHDLGKEALPDHILIGRAVLHATERRLIERHPVDGARLLLRVEGMGEVAAAVLAHHERIDGGGYPDGLSGDAIPMTARIIAVAETYDVLTAPDSYRIAMTAAEAEEELRRSAGTQLDGRLVWLFATQVLQGRQSDHLGHIADLEAELQVQRRVRGVLDAPFVLGPPS